MSTYYCETCEQWLDDAFKHHMNTDGHEIVEVEL